MLSSSFSDELLLPVLCTSCFVSFGKLVEISVLGGYMRSVSLSLTRHGCSFLLLKNEQPSTWWLLGPPRFFLTAFDFLHVLFRRFRGSSI